MPTQQLTYRANLADRWKTHRDKWAGCIRCSLSYTRTHVCLCRGQLPADILFVGEAPGRSEDVIGFPFVGEAGQLFDEILEGALRDPVPVNRPFRFAISNVVGCLPLNTYEGLRPPTSTEAKSCRPRLRQLIRMAKPKGLVYLGQTAEKYLPTNLLPTIPTLTLLHPAAIIRERIPETRRLKLKRVTIRLNHYLHSLLKARR